MSDNEFEERYGALKEIIQKEIQALPPENAKARIKLYLENIAELFISLPVEELTQKFSEIFLENTRTDGEANNDKKIIKVTKNPHADFHISPIDKLSQAVLGCKSNFSLEEFFDPEATIVSTGKKLTVSAILRYEDMPEALLKKIPNRRTRAVHDAMTSLIREGAKAIRLQDIASAMNGYRTDRKATEAFLQEIKQEADWLIHTWATIDATNEAKARGYDFKKVKFDRPLIPAGSVGAMNKRGQIVEAYEIWAEPVLYAYARQKKQVISVPIDMLALPEKLKLTFENIILRNYLIERIEGMSECEMSPVILYETIYEVLEAKESSREHKREIRERAKLMLDNWIALAYIESYVEESDKNKRPEKIIITPYLRKKLKG